MTLETSRSIPQVDGLRAVAAIGVMAFHQGIFPVGWAGVWVFFVISGFVITGMLRRSDWRLTPQSYAGFFWRRAGRIWPLYFLYVALAVAHALLSGAGFPPGGLLSQLTFTQNLREISGSALPLSDHLWTISGEQQFYLLFPFLFAFTRRFEPVRLLAGMIAALVLVRAAAVFLLLRAGADGTFVGAVAYYATPLQFDAFLVGALLAFLPLRTMTGAARRRLALVTAALLLAVAALMAERVVGQGAFAPRAAWEAVRPLVYSEAYGYGAAIWLYPVISVATACVLAYALAGEGRLGRVLGWGPLAWVGLISYGAYVWHRPVGALLFEATGGTERGPALALLAFAVEVPVVVAVAAVSYHWFEKPARSLFLSRRSPRPAVP